LFWHWLGLPALLWLAAVWVITLARAGLSYAYRKRPGGAQDAGRWATFFTVGSVASGTAWGIGCMLLFIPGEPVAELVLAYVVAGMAAGAIVTLSIWLPAALTFLTLIGLGQAGAYLLQGDARYLVLAAMACLMWAIFCAVATRFNRSLVRSLSLRFENLLLGDRLERAHLSEVGSQAKSRFFAAMSHELRTPLNAILGFSEIIKSEMFGPVGSKQYKDYVHSINASAEQLLKMIDEILMLSSMESGRVKLDDQPLDLREAVAAAVESVRETAEAGGVRLTTDLSESCTVLRADDSAFGEILSSLICNAVQFTPRGGQVTVVTELDDDGQLVLRVADGGSAADRENAAKTISDFSRIDSSVAGKFEGPGFGLSVVKALVEIHGGSVDVESRAEAGTTVAARFPAERVVAKAKPAAPGSRLRFV
ncbi:MAG: HAMP domain-containing histidine kinase, partial [Rhodospirillales bacterium]|nr:HAMP domain-containing histidine kinase [Rhodospirillales bacterium]